MFVNFLINLACTKVKVNDTCGKIKIFQNKVAIQLSFVVKLKT
ncbi:hypothetical protein bthur0003_41040 [Bacillus thuringiensis serovar thuringiensis str. T01001]|nr:hypothetical protein H175_ch4342 [Bacillus thuringiensis serovar thuringiensis str. IS5056]ASL67035.1 hypothetical protein FORC47_4190 [Bacillus cereus]EEM26998.1 hypothetical protein bthur0002_41060 [Bacillus thuringiensis Bt407]EEM33410.1 hypothetical protein bthur0003_41040 [Bacillus thuringiensis serovar thuringiensis str. T01001]EEM64274.1 hypothetical protein bthur0008_40570 [Bacillus thuringiensis serovar berliner ATCC 10792]